MNTLFVTALVLNAIWFAMAFNVFAIRNHVFAKILVPRGHRDTKAYAVLVQSGGFLGGFNLAFCVCNLLLLFTLDVFPSDAQRAILLLVFAVAHGSQFAFNVPVALQNRRGGGVWQVFKGTMLLIFVVDCALMLVNAALAAAYYF